MPGLLPFLSRFPDNGCLAGAQHISKANSAMESPANNHLWNRVGISNPTFIRLLLLFGTTICVYGFSLDHQFLTSWDDNKYVTQNPDVFGFSIEHLRAAFTKFYVGNYAPLHVISYMCDYSLWALDPAGYIGENILLHAANGLLFYLLVVKLTNDHRLAFFSGFVFLLHPVQVESVVWISQRKNLLAMFFFLVSFLSYVSYREKERGYVPYCLAVLAFLLALLSKSVVVVLPFVLILYDLCFAPRQFKRQWDKIPFFLAAACVALITLKSQASGVGGGIVDYPDESAYGIFLTMLTVFADYAAMLVWPTKLSIFYYLPIKTGVDASVAWSALLMISLSAGLVYLFRKNRKVFFWAALIPLGLLPVSQIVPLSTLMNDRYLYFPLLGFAVLLPVGALHCTDRLVPQRKWAGAALFFLLLLPLPMLSWQRTYVWHDSLSIWSDALDKSPNFVTYAGMGNALYQADRIPEAIRMYDKALLLEPSCEEALRSLGAIYLNGGQYNKALYYIDLFVEYYPDNAFGQKMLDIASRQINGRMK